MEETLITLVVTAIIGQILAAVGTVKRIESRVARLERRLRFHISACVNGGAKLKRPPAA